MRPLRNLTLKLGSLVGELSGGFNHHTRVLSQKLRLLSIIEITVIAYYTGSFEGTCEL